LGVDNIYNNRMIGLIDIRGKKDKVKIYEILDGNSQRIIDLKNKTKSDFEYGVTLYSIGKYEDSIKQFEKIIKLDERDKCALYYINKNEEELK